VRKPVRNVEGKGFRWSPERHELGAAIHLLDSRGGKPFHRPSGFIVAEMGKAVTFEVEHKRLDIKGLLGDVVDPFPGT